MTEPLDSVDLDALLELERSHGWALVVERIKEQLERNRIQLEAPNDAEITARLRGQITALRVVLLIPGILKDEIKSKLPKE